MTQPPPVSFSTRTWFLVGIATLLLGLIFASSLSKPQAEPDPHADARLVLRSLEQRLLSAYVTEQLTQAQREAVGAYDTPQSVLKEAQKALRALPPSEDLELALVTYAVAFKLDAFAREQLVALAAKPDTLERHQSLLDALTALSANAAPEDGAALWAFAESQHGAGWLVPLLTARQALAQGDTSRSEALQKQANDTAFELVANYVLIGGIDMGSLFLGLFALLFLVGPMRRRALEMGRLTPVAASPYSLVSAIEIFASWLIILTFAPLFLGTLFGQLEGLGTVLRVLVPLIPLVALLVLLKRYPHTLLGREGLWASLGLKPKRFTITIILWGILAYSIAYTMGSSFALLNAILLEPPELQSSLKFLSEREDIWPLLIVVLSAGIIAPLAEEILFRGVLFRTLRDHYSPSIGLFASSFLFALVHGQVGLMLPMFGLGMAFAFIYQWSGSLWLAILAHMGWNLMTIFRMELLWV